MKPDGSAPAHYRSSDFEGTPTSEPFLSDSGQGGERQDKSQKLRPRTLISTIDHLVQGAGGATRASDEIALQPSPLNSPHGQSVPSTSKALAAVMTEEPASSVVSVDPSKSLRNPPEPGFEPLSAEDSLTPAAQGVRTKKRPTRPRIQDLPESERPARREIDRVYYLNRQKKLEQSKELLAKEKEGRQAIWQKYKQSLENDEKKRKKRELQMAEGRKRSVIKRKLQRNAARVAELDAVTITKDSPATSVSPFFAHTRSNLDEARRSSASAAGTSASVDHPQRSDLLQRLRLELNLPYHPKRPRSRTWAVTAAEDQVSGTVQRAPHVTGHYLRSATNEHLQGSTGGQRARLDIDLNLPPPTHQE